MERQGAFDPRPNWKEQPGMPDDWVKIKNIAHLADPTLTKEQFLKEARLIFEQIARR
jgi:hypothetical protein